MHYISLRAIVLMPVLLYYCIMHAAYIYEIFSSVQGEGPHVGRRHLFVRFLGCDIRCRFCDTPAVHYRDVPCRLQKATGSPEYRLVSNPVSADEATSYVHGLAVWGPSRPWLSLTGGEPLLQKDFLLSFLPKLRPVFDLYLETNGIHYPAMRDIVNLIDTVSMDFKLPSSTGLLPFWEEHAEFLSVCRGRDVFVKTVVTCNTTDDDIVSCVEIISKIDDTIPLIIQPATGSFAPPAARLLFIQDYALTKLKDVRIIPQVHKILDLP